jgi:hypothetical protein
MTEELSLATATPVEGGYMAECPTTHELYICVSPRTVGSGVVALVCACCDAMLRTGDACDPLEPQFHIYFEAR